MRSPLGIQPPICFPTAISSRFLRDARAAAARLIHSDVAEIWLTNTSHGLSLAARALPIRKDDVVLVPDKEFPANVYPWLLLRDKGVDVEFAPSTPERWPNEEYLLERLADPRVRVLAISFVQFSNGYRANLNQLSEACREHNVFFVVDAIQGLGQCPLDVRETPIDTLVSGGQKWSLSPSGSGFVYVRQALLELLEPVVCGWMAFAGTDDFTRLTDYHPKFHLDGRRFEMITLPFQDFMGMTESLTMLTELGLENIAAYTHVLKELPVAACRGGTVPYQFAHPIATRIGDRLCDSSRPGRGISQIEVRQRGMLDARRSDSFVAALLQHGGGNERVAGILAGE